MKTIKEISLKNPQRYENAPDFKTEKLKSAIDAALKKVDYMIETLGEGFAEHASVNNVYEKTDNTDGWNQGFWTGILWISWELTGDDKYKNLALASIPSYRKRITEKIGVNHHDMGFLYIPSCVAAYKLTGDETARDTAILAADNLMERYHEKGRFIQAWGELGTRENYRLIVDCLLNIPLLYWASNVTGDNKYRDAAYAHFRTTVENALRSDGTSYHTFYFDPETGKPLKGVTHQGASDNSCWARGQAWGIYGLMLTKAYVDDPDAVRLCKNMANVFLDRLPDDYVAYWDLIFTDGDNEPRDSSACAIAVCGMLELIKHIPDSDKSKYIYENAVNLIMNSLYENYSTKDMPESNGLLLHATYGKPQGLGVDECNIWGCYFYMEALIRLYKNWNMYW